MNTRPDNDRQLDSKGTDDREPHGLVASDEVSDDCTDGGVDIITQDSPDDHRVEEMLQADTINLDTFAPAVSAQDAPDAADTLEELDASDRAAVVYQMDDRVAAQNLVEMELPLAASTLIDLAEEYGPDEPARYLNIVEDDDAVDLLQALPPDLRETILRRLPARKAIKFRQLATYDPETAGGIMTTEFVALPASLTIAESIEQLRRHPVRDFDDVFCLDDESRLVGVISCRDMLISRPDERLAERMERHVDAVLPAVDREEIATLIDRYNYTAIPVVDVDDHLLGIVTVDDVIDVIRAEHTEDAYKMVGAGKGEVVYSTVGQKLRGRLPWLVINLFTSVLGAAVVAWYDEQIRQFAFLAVLMPMIANQAGNSGQQSLAITIRSLVLGELRSRRVWPLIWRELAHGLLAGVILGGFVGALLAGAASAGLLGETPWQVGLVFAAAMTGSIATGCLVGTGIPLLMTRLKADPATASTIFLTAITDSVSFFAILALAARALPG